ncbi:glycosyltransferase family 2 protein [Atopomonas sediminilitoris]|uniref:glycosyltransferase family 2 protein n=1 Tax=Atopomonas sediminilitoris TaxID=2919919 RepID=UPI001F4D4894|nr:glycosyltransferase family 2 protein [Atopomonas sediminilitoris]MCJ8170370.1 glycosyltransferase family 2 protein [Atopomonas sediminilitoris]
MFKPCAVIPVFNHEEPLPAVVAQLRAQGLPCVLVDDASSASCHAVMQRLAEASDVHLVCLAHNLGKGGAVTAGLWHAHQLGFSHALQVDADGQHCLDDVARFLAAGQHNPHALICGYPAYDASIPKGRLYGRYLTHVWVWINTLSLSIRDSMCGFRLYPLQPVVALLNQAKLGQRMDFDPEILVRLHWRGQAMQWLETRVTYPADGLSHFRLWQDNWLISRMHARLFFGMLLRLPRLLQQRRQRGRT